MVTLEEAKKTLGDKAKDMSDEQILKTVDWMYQFANLLLDTYEGMTPEQRKKLSKTRKNSKKN